MKLKKTHWLVYNYNFVFDKSYNHLNKNFCDLFWGGLVLFAVLLSFVVVPYLIGLIAYWSGTDFRQKEDKFLATNIARIFANFLILFVIAKWYIHIQENGWLYGGLYTFLTAIGIIAAIVGLFVLGSFIKEKVEDWRYGRSREESKSNVMAEGFKSIKEKYCPIVEFED